MNEPFLTAIDTLTSLERGFVACMKDEKKQAGALFHDVCVQPSQERQQDVAAFLDHVLMQRPFIRRTWIELAEKAPTAPIKLSCLKMAVLFKPEDPEAWRQMMSLCVSIHDVELKNRLFQDIYLLYWYMTFPPEKLGLELEMLCETDEQLDLGAARALVYRNRGRRSQETYYSVPIRQFRDWLVTTGGVESRFGSYDIDWREVWRPHWERQLRDKVGALGSYEDFLQALTFARLFFPAAGAHDPQIARAYQRKHAPKSENWFEGKRIHTALGGLKVRSKSEVIIANLLAMQKIPFVYEQRLEVEDGTYRLPDFTFTWNGRTYYWEHLGMMEDMHYLIRSDERLRWYLEHGFADALIVTTEVGGLDCDALLALLQEKLT